MNYTEAIEAAKQGKKLSRKGWCHLFGWYYVTAYEDSLTMNDPCNGVPTIIRQWEYEPSKEDTRARDWVEYAKEAYPEHSITAFIVEGELSLGNQRLSLHLYKTWSMYQGIINEHAMVQL